MFRHKKVNRLLIFSTMRPLHVRFFPNIELLAVKIFRCFLNDRHRQLNYWTDTQAIQAEI